MRAGVARRWTWFASRYATGRWRVAWRVLSAVTIIAFGVTQIDWNEVGSALTVASVPLIAASWALLLAGQVVSGIRWSLIAAELGSAAPRNWFVRAYLRGCFYNVFLPSGLGGDAMRLAVLRREMGVRGAGRTIVYDRVGGLVALCLIAAVALPWTPYLEPAAVQYGVAAAGIAGVAGTAGWLLRRGLVALLAWTLVFEVLWLAGIWTLSHAIHIPLEPAAVAAVTVIVSLAIALPISIGATGTREAGMVLAVAPLGIGTADGVALGIAFGVVLALVGLVGAPLPVTRETGTSEPEDRVRA
jgi:glycosyltransferase 2 family protein